MKEDVALQRENGLVQGLLFEGRGGKSLEEVVPLSTDVEGLVMRLQLHVQQRRRHPQREHLRGLKEASVRGIHFRIWKEGATSYVRQVLLTFGGSMIFSSSMMAWMRSAQVADVPSSTSILIVQEDIR